MQQSYYTGKFRAEGTVAFGLLSVCLNLPAIISQTTVKRIVAALMLRPVFVFRKAFYVKRLTFS